MAIPKPLKKNLNVLIKALKTRLKELGFKKRVIDKYVKSKNFRVSLQIDAVTNVINDKTIKKDLDEIAKSAKNTIKNRKKRPLFTLAPDENTTDIIRRKDTKHKEKLYQEMKDDILDGDIKKFVVAAKKYRDNLKKAVKLEESKQQLQHKKTTAKAKREEQTERKKAINNLANQMRNDRLYRQINKKISDAIKQSGFKFKDSFDEKKIKELNDKVENTVFKTAKDINKLSVALLNFGINKKQLTKIQNAAISDKGELIVEKERKIPIPKRIKRQPKLPDKKKRPPKLPSKKHGKAPFIKKKEPTRKTVEKSTRPKM